MSLGCYRKHKLKVEPNVDLVDQTFSQFNENLINNQDQLSQNERVEYPNQNDWEEGETYKTSKFIPQILTDDGMSEGINSLNVKQREVFSVVHTRAKYYVKYNEHNVEPNNTFLLAVEVELISFGESDI